MTKTALAFFTKDKVELSRRTIKPLLDTPCDLFWFDGSDSTAGQELPKDYPTLTGVYHNVRGGPDAAVAFALTTLLQHPARYSHIGLVENDVLLGFAWFAPTFDLFARGRAEGLDVGAVSARCYEDRILIQRDGYAVMHNLGFGQQIMTRHAAELALEHFRTGWTTDNRRLFCQLSGIDIGSYWAFGTAEHQVTADWNQERVLAAYGLAALALTPSPVEMIGQTPPLHEQGLTIATRSTAARVCPDSIFERYVDTTQRAGRGHFRCDPLLHYRDANGATVFMPHQVFKLEQAGYVGDWRLKWNQGFGPFAWRAESREVRFEVMLTGSCEFMVSGGTKGGQVLLEDLKSGYAVKPVLPPEGQAMSLVAPCGISHRLMRLTALSPGIVFYGLRCRESQPLHPFAFDPTVLPPP